MTHVEGTGNIWRGDYDRINRTFFIWVRAEILMRYPVCIPFFLDTEWMKSLI